MPFHDDNLQYIIIPANGVPGQARIVITSVLPPPLDTYTFTDRSGVSGRYTGGIIFYANDNTLPFDTTYTYLCVVSETLGNAVADVHMGTVVNGVVQEYAAGFPAVQLWAGNFGANGTERWISGGIVGLEANGAGAGGGVTIRGINTAPIVLRTDASTGAVSIITASGAISFTANTTGGINFTTNTGNISLNASGVGANADIFAANRNRLAGSRVSLDASSQIEVKTTRAYLLTQIQTNAANANLNLTAVAQTVPNCTMTLPTVTANAKYEARIVMDSLNTAGVNSTAIGELLVDGALQAGQALALNDVANGNRDTVTQQYSGNLATAGNHVFTFTAKDSVGAGNSQVQAAHCTLQVLIFESGG